MRLIGLALFLALALCGLPTRAQAPVHNGQTGAALEAAVRASHSPTQVLSYSNARHALFAQIDNQAGKVRLLYTGDEITTNVPPSPNFVNVEHIWPQSRFGTSVGNKKADLHHLAPTYATVNSTRGNNPFAEIPDQQTTKWWAASTFLTGIPGANLDHFSESTSQRFEPREADKGNVARAMFYFRAIYGTQNIELAFFEQQKATLLQWHQADPADPVEIARNGRVAAIQGNRNPFIDDATLATRMFAPTAAGGGATPVVAASQPAAPVVLAGAPTIQDGEEIHVMTWNLRFFYDADITDNTSELARNESADTPAEFDARVKAVATVIKKAGLPQVIALQEVENQKVVERLAQELNTAHGGKYKVGFVQGTDTFTEQDVAYLYQDRPVQVGFARIPAAGFANPTLHKVPSKHCVMTVAHTLPTGQVQRVSFINLHLKAGTGAGNEAERRKQGRVVNGFIRQQLTADPTAGFVVLGDINAQVRSDATTAADVVGVLRGLETADPLDDLIDLNDELPAAKRSSHVSNRELDRILVSGALLDDTGLIFKQMVIRKDLISANQSDHFPMVATFTYKATPSQ
jgi:hypothetical protein